MRRLFTFCLALLVAGAGCNLPVGGGGGGDGGSGGGGNLCTDASGLPTSSGTVSLAISANEGANLIASGTIAFSGKNGASATYNKILTPSFVGMSALDASACPPYRTFGLYLYGTPAAGKTYTLQSASATQADGSASLDYEENTNCSGNSADNISGWEAKSGTVTLTAWSGTSAKVTVAGAAMSGDGVSAAGGNKATGTFTLDGMVDLPCVGTLGG